MGFKPFPDSKANITYFYLLVPDANTVLVMTFTHSTNIC